MNGYLTFFVGQEDFAAEPGNGDRDPQPRFQELREAVDEMVRALVALMNQRVLHADDFDIPVGFGESGDSRVMFPDGIGRGPDIGLKLSGMGEVQIADGSRQDRRVARTLAVIQNQTAHARTPSRMDVTHRTWTHAGRDEAACGDKIPAAKGRGPEQPKSRNTRKNVSDFATIIGGLSSEVNT